MLGLTYPSGKEIDTLAHLGNDTFNFPRAMIHDDNYDFSFSGLKSAFINLVHNANQKGTELSKEDLAASFQASVVDVLTAKTIRACQNWPVKQLIVAGGVAANKGLRERLSEELPKEVPGVELIVPPLRLCGDNAAMIGAAAHVELAKQNVGDYRLNAKPGLALA